MIKKQQNVIKDQQGVALLVVVLILLVFTILFSGAIFSADNNLQQAVKVERYTETYYSAESGINILMEGIIQEAEKLEVAKHPISTFETTLDGIIATGLTSASNSVTLLSPWNYRVQIGGIESLVGLSKIVASSSTPNTVVLNYQLVSNGTKENMTRSLTSSVRIEYTESVDADSSYYMDVAILASGTVDLTGLTVKEAPVASTSLVAGSIKQWWGSNIVEGYKLINHKTCNPNPDPRFKYPNNYDKLSQLCLVDEYTYGTFTPQIQMPEIPTTYSKLPYYQRTLSWGAKSNLVDLNGNFKNEQWEAFTYVFPSISNTYYAPSFEIINNAKITLDVGDRDIQIITDNLSLSSQYEVIGTGSLTFYVTNKKTDNFKLSSSSGVMGNPEDTIKTIIYSYGSKTVTISGAAKYYLSIMGDQLKFNATGSGGFNGNFVSGGTSVNVSGGSGTDANLFYAPNATFTLSGSGIIRGGIVVKNFVSSGSVEVIYDPDAFTNLPFIITSPQEDTNDGGSPIIKGGLTIVQNPTVEE